MKPSVFDICVEYSQFSRSLHRESHPQSRLKKRLSLIKSIYRHFSNADKFHEKINSNKLKNRKLVFFGTKNQFNTLQKKNMQDCVKMTPSFINSNLPKADYYYLGWKEALYAVLFSYRTIYDFCIEKDSFKKSTIWTGLSSYFFATGSYQYWLSILRRVKPCEVIISNDYNYINRALIYAAKKLKIKTTYIPHVLIGTKFYTPPLMICDEVYITGELEYQRVLNVLPKQSSANIKHFSRFEFSSFKMNHSNKYRIGISINSVDDFENVLEEIYILKRYYPGYNFILRPHPTMEFSLRNDCDFEVNNSELLSEYFSLIDIHVSGSSMIHIDSILHNIPSFIFECAIDTEYYGFYENSIIGSVNDLKKSNINFNEILNNQQERVKSLLVNLPNRLKGT